MEKLSSTKLIPGAKKIGDDCPRGYPFLDGELDPETLQPALLRTEDRTAYLGLSLLPVCN